MSIKNLDCVIGIGILGGLLYVGITAADIAKKLKSSIKDLSQKTEIDISNDLVNRAVNEAVSREAQKAAKKVSDSILAKVDWQIRDAVTAEVRIEKSAIRNAIAKKLHEETSKMDVQSFKREVREAAKEQMIEKFRENLDDITDKYKTNLDTLSEIYTSIAQSAPKQEEKVRTLEFKF